MIVIKHFLHLFGNMNLTDTASIFRFHQNLIHTNGAGSLASLGWKNAAAQQARYRALSTIANLTDCSVMDAGCGHGDLRHYLGNIYPRFRYIGVEKIPALLNIAIERCAHLPETIFFEGDFSAADLPVTDYTIACGSLSYRNSDELYIFKMIEKLFTCSRRGFGFNLLNKTESAHGIIASYHPAVILGFCHQLTANIRFTDGYWENDFTVLMYHS